MGETRHMSQPGSNDPLEIAQENDLKSSALTLLNELTYFAVPPSDMTRRDPLRGPQLDPRDLWVKTSTSCHYTPNYYDHYTSFRVSRQMGLVGAFIIWFRYSLANAPHMIAIG